MIKIARAKLQKLYIVYLFEMFDINAFFRRNEKLFWFMGAFFVLVLGVVQIDKNINSDTAQYSFIGQCSTYQAPDAVSKPLNRSQIRIERCVKS